jgi:hypothetical protein
VETETALRDLVAEVRNMEVTLQDLAPRVELAHSVEIALRDHIRNMPQGARTHVGKSEPGDQAHSMIGEPEADGPAIRAEAQEQSQEVERTVDNTGRNGAKAEAAFRARTSWLKDRLPVTSIDGSVPRIEKAMSPGGDGEKKSVMLPAVVAEGPGPGRKANVEANLSIARVVESFGRNWRDRLTEVCDALDLQKLALPGSKKWKGKGCSDWTDVLSEDQEGLVKALQHRLDWVSEHPTDDPDQPRG